MFDLRPNLTDLRAIVSLVRESWRFAYTKSMTAQEQGGAGSTATYVSFVPALGITFFESHKQ